MKKTVVVSSVIMCLALLVAIISVTAAWFGDIRDGSTTIIISSSRPKGSASFDVESANPGYDPNLQETWLSPAVAKEDTVLDDHDGSKFGEDFNVLDESELLDKTATQVTISIPFMYVGAPDTGKDTKEVRVIFKGAYLEIPKEGSTPMNYSREFVCDMQPGQTVKEGEQEIFIPLDEGLYDDGTDGVLTVYLNPGITYTLQVTVYFRYVDEECDPTLLDTTIFFCFDVEAV